MKKYKTAKIEVVRIDEDVVLASPEVTITDYSLPPESTSPYSNS